MVWSASLGQLRLSRTFVIEAFVEPWAEGWWEGKCMQPDFGWDVQGIHCPRLRVRDQRDMEMKFLIQAFCV